jgi:hypothetical protein
MCGVSGKDDPRWWRDDFSCPECVELSARINSVKKNAWELLVAYARSGSVPLVSDLEACWRAAHLHQDISIRRHKEAWDLRVREVKKTQTETFEEYPIRTKGIDDAS